MRSLSLLLVAVVALACSAANAMTAPVAAGTVFFKIDPVSCNYTSRGPVTFMISNVDVGTEALAPGETSTGYQGSGFVTVQARIANWTSTRFTTPTTLWTLRYSVNIPTSGSVIHTFTC